MKRVPVDTFISLNKSIPIIDVRSPVEYHKGHINGAFNIPIFSNEERHEIGIIYKNLGRETAIEKGLGIVGPKMQRLAENAKKLSSEKLRKVYCWRGGMRSEKMAWLFEMLDMECDVLEGGYKAYRNLQINDFKSIKKLNILHGSTGCGKTDILYELEKAGEQIIDLEGLANHRGSAFGHIGLPAQPTSQQFQNDIHHQLTKLDPGKPVWVEGESLKIGSVCLPDEFWCRMKAAHVIEIKIDRELRLKRLVVEYGSFPKTELAQSIINLANKISAEKIKSALHCLETEDFAGTADFLLDYYDRTYEYTRKRFRENSIVTVYSNSGNPKLNSQKILKQLKEQKNPPNELQN